VSYKVYATHMASQHGALEMVMLDEGPEARALVERLIDTEEKRRRVAAPAPAAAPKPTVEVKEDPPEEEEEEATAEATARDAATTAGLHPGLLPAPPGSTIEALDALMEDLGGVTTTSSSAGVVRCRFEACGEEGQAAELKLHYAGVHYPGLFPLQPDSTLPQGFATAGARTVCCRCTETTGRPAYVGEEGPRAHLVSAHDTLGELLLQETGDLLAQQVIGDLYPELLEWIPKD